MHLISILIFLFFPFVALAQGSGSTGGTGGAGTTGALSGSVLPAPTGHRQMEARGECLDFAVHFLPELLGAGKAGFDGV